MGKVKQIIGFRISTRIFFAEGEKQSAKIMLFSVHINRVFFWNVVYHARLKLKYGRKNNLKMLITHDLVHEINLHDSVEPVLSPGSRHW